MQETINQILRPWWADEEPHEFIRGRMSVKRYIDLGNGVYQAKGIAVAVEYGGPEIQFTASWGEPMVLKPGDMVVSPMPDLNEVYRIARKEFFETYEQ